MTTIKGLTRRHALAATGAGVLAAGLGVRPSFAELATVKQGYQTNMWGMPTYYLLHSGALEKHGVKGTVALNSDVCAHYPQMIDAGRKLGWEWMGHGENNSTFITKYGRCACGM